MNLFFKNIKIQYNKIINLFAGSTFGVLLIHAAGDNMRQWLWKDVLNNVGMFDSKYMPLHAIGSVIGIFVVCAILDMLRIKFIETPFFCLWDKHYGKIKNKFLKFESKILYDFVISSSNVLVVFKSVGMGVEYQLACLDKYAAVLYEDIVEDTIFDIALYQSTSYVLTEKNIKCFDSYNNEVINVDSSSYGCSLLTLDNGKIYHCSDTSAVLLDKTSD